MDKFQLIPSHAIGMWLVDMIHRSLDWLGLSHSQVLEEWIYVAIILALSLVIGWIVRRLLVAMLRKVVSLRKDSFTKQMLKERTITKCSHFITPLMFLAFVPIAFNQGNHLLDVIERVMGTYAIVAVGYGIAAVMTLIFNRYNERENTRNLPLRGILGIAKGINWAVIVILSVSLLIDKSPAALLTGLGALSAVLMLVFQDSIKGFVAGVQVSQNDMLHIGDWIVVPGTPANGTVLDVSLTAVKIQNFDNTFVTVPPYSLVSGSFQNYRGMKESGARRLDPSLIIDTPTIVPLTDDIIKNVLEKYPEVAPFVAGLQKSGKLIQSDPGIRPTNGTIETNLGLFRAYACQYLLSSPWINNTMQVLVQILNPTAQGMPLQFYAFTITTDWNEFEGIRSAVIEHFIAAAPDFGLAIYTSGSETVTLAQDTSAEAIPAVQPKALQTPSAQSNNT